MDIFLFFLQFFMEAALISSLKHPNISMYRFFSPIDVELFILLNTIGLLLFKHKDLSYVVTCTNSFKIETTTTKYKQNAKCL